MDVKVSACGARGALVALTCETAFVAGAADVEVLLGALCVHVLANNPQGVVELLGQTWVAGGSVQDALTEISRKLGGSVSIAGAKLVLADKGYVGGYVHHNQEAGALCAIATEARRGDTGAVLKQLGMHVLATQPTALVREDIDKEKVDRLIAMCREQTAGEPEEIQDRFIQSTLNKFYAGVCLREQPWVMEDSKSVQEAITEALGEGSIITDYAHFSRIPRAR